MRSLGTFKREFRARLLDIHWRQWTTLGVASRLERGKNFTIDLEALAVSTLNLGMADKRLLAAATDWMAKNRQWLNLSRFNRIARCYCETEKTLNRVLVTREVVSLYLQFLKPASKRTDKKDSSPGVEEAASTDVELELYREIFEMAHGKGTAVEPNLRDPCLLQLFFRGVFGINARAEILLYLLFRERGNSNNIAKGIGFDQKIVYRMLERWTAAGFVEKAGGRSFQLSPTSDLKAILPSPTLPRYTNWIHGFLLLGKISAAIDTEPFSSDQYLLSSFFRDLIPDARILAGTVGLSFSDDRLHEGSDYFEVFSTELLDVLDGL
jgi:hypothetical protein